ncbi:MAG: hypothetical protein RIQ56_498 [Candidatus Parcubacteria bacterium]
MRNYNLSKKDADKRKGARNGIEHYNEDVERACLRQIAERLSNILNLSEATRASIKVHLEQYATALARESKITIDEGLQKMNVKITEILEQQAKSPEKKPREPKKKLERPIDSYFRALNTFGEKSVIDRVTLFPDYNDAKTVLKFGEPLAKEVDRLTRFAADSWKPSFQKEVELLITVLTNWITKIFKQNPHRRAVIVQLILAMSRMDLWKEANHLKANPKKKSIDKVSKPAASAIRSDNDDRPSARNVFKWHTRV